MLSFGDLGGTASSLTQRRHHGEGVDAARNHLQRRNLRARSAVGGEHALLHLLHAVLDEGDHRVVRQRLAAAELATLAGGWRATAQQPQEGIRRLLELQAEHLQGVSLSPRVLAGGDACAPAVQLLADLQQGADVARQHALAGAPVHVLRPKLLVRTWKRDADGARSGVRLVDEGPPVSANRRLGAVQGYALIARLAAALQAR